MRLHNGEGRPGRQGGVDHHPKGHLVPGGHAAPPDVLNCPKGVLEAQCARQSLHLEETSTGLLALLTVALLVSHTLHSATLLWVSLSSFCTYHQRDSGEGS